MKQIQTKLISTRCCICGKPLTDTESVEHGIGPVCSKRYYNPKHKPNQEQVMKALGLIHLSNLPDHIIKEFKKAVNNNKTNARLGSNVLVYYAACKYHDRFEVFKCSRIIRELGYTEMADRLETDRTKVTILKEKNRYLVAIPNQWKAIKAISEIAGAEDTGTKQGRKHIWELPLNARKHLSIIIGMHFGGRLACGTKKDGTTGVWTIPKKTITDLNVYLISLNPDKKIEQDILTTDDKFVYIKTPFNRIFKDELKNTIPKTKRGWDPKNKRWIIDLNFKRIARRLVLHHFYGVTI